MDRIKEKLVKNGKTMNLKEALKALIEGKKIKCKAWINKKCYIHMPDNIILYSDGSPYRTPLNHYSDDMWELYEEPKKAIDELNEAWDKFMKSNGNFDFDTITIIKKIIEYLNQIENEC